MKKIQSVEELEEVISRNSNVIIYGAGGGTALTEKLLLEYPDLLFYIAVTAKDGYPYTLLGKQVFCIERFINIANACVVVIATLEGKQKPIFSHLQSLGFHNIYGIRDDFYNQLKWMTGQLQNEKDIFNKRYIAPYVKCVERICKDYQVETGRMKEYVEQAFIELKSERLHLARLVVILGTKCSLRCKDCDNLIPYFKPQEDLESKKILDSLEILSKKADTILKCELIGGEPFLSNNLGIILEFLLGKKNIYQIEITTNGMILPQKEQIPLLMNKKVKVRISDYGALVDKEKIIDYLSENNISYEILELGKWVRSNIMDSEEKSVCQLQSIYEKCDIGYLCKTLYEDKIFACAKAASLYALGYMKEQEYVEVRKETSVKEFKEFFLKSYSVACSFCGRTEKPIYVEPAIQLKE